MSEYDSRTTSNNNENDKKVNEEKDEDNENQNDSLGDYLFKMFEKGKSAEYYMNLLNVRTAKIIAVVLVILFGGVYHGALHLFYGVTPCKGLLKDVNKAPVLMRAYKASCIGGKKNQWVEPTR